MSGEASGAPGCPACGTAWGEERMACTASDGREFRYGGCPGCGLYRLTPLPVPAEIAGFYDTAYYGAGERKFPALMDQVRGLFLRRRAMRVARWTGRAAGRALDVGCGDGRFLGHMQQLGWQVSGTELPGAAFDRAQKIPGIQLHAGTLTSGLFPPASFDAITIWHVLEHVPDPLALLRACRDLLAPGGLLVVEVPNTDSWQNQLFGALAFNVDPPRHLYQFGPDSLGRLLARAGFSVRRRETSSLEMGVIGAAQSVMNGLIKPRDLFYDLLRSRWKCPGRPAAKWMSLLLAAPLLPAGLILTVAETLAGHGPALRLVCEGAANSSGGS